MDSNNYMAEVELNRIGRLSLVKANEYHAEQIADKLRLSDRKECLIHDMSPLEALTEPLVWEGAFSYSLKLDNDCIAMCGTVPIDENCGRVWLLGTGAINQNFRTFLRGCKYVRDLLQGEYSQIENLVPADHHETIMWLTWCGFTFDEQPYDLNGHAMIRFVRCVKRKNNVYYFDKRPVIH
tara:strand:- start:250 stop:792 length:543 start_codon:yes stop_codon:yes gene_type:complete